MNPIAPQTDQRPTVHILDDDADIRLSLQRLIEPLGVGVRCYDSPLTLLHELEPEQPGCVLSDLCMPEMALGLVPATCEAGVQKRSAKRVAFARRIPAPRPYGACAQICSWQICAVSKSFAFGLQATSGRN